MIFGDSGAVSRSTKTGDVQVEPVRYTDLIAATDRLREAAGELDVALEKRAAELSARLGAGEFRLAFCGGFSNGKSTLINALLGAPVLPVGVLPVTAVPTEIVAGPDLEARVELVDGTATSCAVDALADWVTEKGNPVNYKGVKRAVVTAPSELLKSGVMLVDTPGLESIFEHNDEAALATIRDADATVVVFSADSPITAAERRLLDVVADRSSITFFVLNRADHLSPDDANEAVAFIAHEVDAATGLAAPVYALSARESFDAIASGQPSGPLDAGMRRFRTALEEFVSEHLVEVRLDAFGRAVSRLADAIEDREGLERAALEMTSSELTERVERFSTAATEQRHSLDEDRILLAEAAKAIDADLTQWMRTAGARIPDGSFERFAAAAGQSRLRHLEARLDSEIETIVGERFDELRPQAAERISAAWGRAADEFTTKVQGRVDAIRLIATGEFGASLLPVSVPAVGEEPDRFWYYFFRPTLPDAPVLRALRLLLPHGFVRRRLLASACERLPQELDKHAGRARSDLSRRLEATHRRFAAELVAFVDSVVEEIEHALVAADVRRRHLGDRDLEMSERHRRISLAVSGARHVIYNSKDHGSGFNHEEKPCPT